MGGTKGVGINMHVNIVQKNNNLTVSGESSIFSTAPLGDTNAYLNATLIVDGRKSSTQTLIQHYKSYYTTKSYEPLGEAYFKIPTNGSISLYLRGVWTIDNITPIKSAILPYPVYPSALVKIK